MQPENVTHATENGVFSPPSERNFLENCGSVDFATQSPDSNTVSAAQTPYGGPDSGLVSGPPATVGSVDLKHTTCENTAENPHQGFSCVDFAPEEPTASGETVSEADSEAEDSLNVIPMVDAADYEHDLQSPKHPKYQPGGEWAYANELQSRLFFVTQYLHNPDTDEVLLDEQTVRQFCEGKAVKRYGWVIHDKDVLSDKEAREMGRQPGELKAAHVHLALEMNNATSVGAVARKLGIPPQYVEVKKGRGVFMDLMEYLTHEHPAQQELGKHRYDDSEVHSNLKDWREQLNEHVARRSENGKNRNLGERVKKLKMQVLRGELTLRQALNADDEAYAECFTQLRGLRSEYLGTLPPPDVRMNFHVAGMGRSGKTVMAKALAQSLYPHLEAHECYFVVGEKNVSFQQYDGQPVIIYDDYRAVDFIMDFGRSGTFRMFDQHPGKVVMNIKYGAVNLVNEVSIVTAVESYEDFCNGLAGTYKDRAGNEFEAEDDRQSYGRFPFFSKVDPGSFTWFMNRGFVDGHSYHSTQEVLRCEQSWQEYSKLLDTLSEDEQREVTLAAGETLFKPLLEKAHPKALQRERSGDKQAVLAELTAPGKVRLRASTQYGDNAYFDLGDGVLKAAEDLYLDEISDLVPVPAQWYGVARAKVMLDEIQTKYVDYEREPVPWLDELIACRDEVLGLEACVSQHPLTLAWRLQLATERETEVFRYREGKDECSARLLQKVQTIRTWVAEQISAMNMA